MNYNSFVKRIREVEQSPQKYFILDSDLPLPVFFGLDSGGRPTLRVEDIGKKFSSSEIASTEGILVLSFESKEMACLSFTLINNNNADIFHTLCFDLFESTRKESRQEALVALLDRFQQWQNLLKGVRTGVMTIPQQQGLAAELLALLYFAETTGFDTAVDAWVGPFHHDKDFEFCDDWAEVKSCTVSATAVTISSIEQLDSTVPGSLLVYRFDRVPETKDNAVSLHDVVERVRSVATSPHSRAVLENKLLLANYYDGENEYQKRCFMVNGRDIYNVNDSFPCLRRDNVKMAITACEYSISLPAIEDFKEEAHE